ncbi:DUF134 domain-containing protein [uncultured Desulfovibrio sp.]|uniref:DUF134 domain-containing protein n=1 Tax=uncultured Desulfovibrio sp. TaxID=167968 RepID=UPI002205CA85|nr:DUF134 domain-containing protein [uncultured Desulfovibrio sp.]CAI3240845.1 hypothetical protein DWUX_2386 [Desulfovibrio diazotrophicus]
MARPCHCRRVSGLPKARYFKPRGVPMTELEEAVLTLDGLEALRLADQEGLNMDAAAARMGVSRHTFGRLLRRARQCVAGALVHSQALRIEGGVCAVGGAEEEEATPPTDGLLAAVPSQAPGGLAAAPEPHFGRCTTFTLARVHNGVVGEVRVRAGLHHEQGDCAAVVQALRDMGVGAVLAGGLGLRPLRELQAAGMAVYHHAGLPSVADCLKAFAAGELALFGEGQICQAGKF